MAATASSAAASNAGSSTSTSGWTTSLAAGSQPAVTITMQTAAPANQSKIFLDTIMYSPKKALILRQNSYGNYTAYLYKDN
jgi:hypothetical protein